MNPDFHQLLEDGIRRLPETRKLFMQLKKRKPSDLDMIMADLHEQAFRQIDCLLCGNCCRSLGPRITDRDIAHLSKALRQRPSQLTDNHFRIDEEGDYVFRSMPCLFLGDDNYCAVYSHRPQACATYPHTDRRRFVQLLDITLLNVRTCPAVALITKKLVQHYSQL